MPVSRYEIRNEYSLADPELYQTADKDDPEALLEGVAMAGLVGLLRQLGDLAEFAAEIFHNLHEEVVATAARGHGLMGRVQQLEAEIPYIEKAFLSQTDHSSFFSHSGVDWHPNVRVDQNLVTQGDLPRFIMDSYEECREPPRLFLLDKFDVAGAGACLKRYTDPSFYKVECTDISSANTQREKKILKAKRKGPRWKNGEVPETSLVSHAKLHQLFLEEHVGNGVSSSSSRVKLKRRLNGYPFDTKTGKSYMEKILRSSSPDDEEFHEVTKDPGPLISMANEQDKLKSEVIEERQSSPSTLSVRRQESALSSSVSEEATKPYGIPADDIISTVPHSHPSNETEVNGISLTHDRGSCESKRGDNLLGYISDDISSEIDYVDAPSTVETEMDTDSEMKVKGASTSSYSNDQPLMSDVNEENHYSRSESQPIVDSISDAGSSSSKKEMLNRSSHSSSISAESSSYDKNSVGNLPCADIPETEVVDSSSDKKSADEHFPTQQYSKTMVHEGSCTGLDEVTVHNSDFERLNYSMSSGDSPPIIANSDSSEVGKNRFSEIQLHGMVSNHDDIVKEALPITDAHSSSVSDSDPPKEGDCPDLSAGELPLSEADCKNVHVSSDPNKQPPSREDRGFFECPKTLTANHPDIFHNREEDIMDELETESLNSTAENEPLNLVEASPELEDGEVSVSIDRSYHVEDNHTDSFIDNQICSTVSNALHLPDSPNYGSNSSIHGRFVNREEDITKGDIPSSGSSALPWYPRKIEETAEILDNTPDKFDSAADNSFSTSEKVEELVENISSPSGQFEEAAEASCFTPQELEEPAEKSHYTPEISEDHTEKLCSSPERTEDPSEISCCSTKLEEPDKPMQSCVTPEKFEESAGFSGTRQTDEIIVYTEPDEQEIADSCADLKSSHDDVRVFDESVEEKDNAASEEMASDKPYKQDDNSFPIYPNKMDMESTLYSVDSVSDEPENDKNVVPGNHLESGLTEEANEAKDDTSVVDAVFVESINHQPEIADDDKPNSHLSSEINFTSEVSNPSEIQSREENDHLDEEFLNEGGLLNRDFDAPLQSNCDREQPTLPDKTDLPPDQFDPKLSEFDELASDAVNCELMKEEVILQGDDDPPSAHDGQELQISGGTKLDSTPWTPINQQEIVELNDHQGASDSVSFSPLNHTNQFSSELPAPNEFDFSLPLFPNNPLAPSFPPPNPFIGSDQVNLTDLPPLPPLPPVQWRLGKQLLSATEVSSSRKDSSRHEISTSFDIVSTYGVSTNQPPLQMLPETEENIENSTPVKRADTVHQTAYVEQLYFVPSDSSISVVDDNSHETVELPPTIENEPSPNAEASASADGVTVSEEALTQSSLPVISTSLESAVDVQPKIESDKKQLENEAETPTANDGVGNGVRSLKARLPSPLVDDASVLDKGKASLRKVVDRVRPELKKVDERDSFLQQIKTRSFNLKPAVPSRPTTRGPSTNLKLAAILEKANAIRQALADSDEDDDSWSDS